MAMLTFTDSRPSTRSVALGRGGVLRRGRRRVPVVRGVEVLAGDGGAAGPDGVARVVHARRGEGAQERCRHGTPFDWVAGARGSGGGSPVAAGGTHGGGGSTFAADGKYGGREELGGCSKHKKVEN